MDRVLSDADRIAEPDSWLPVPLWFHGRELASVIARVLQGLASTTPSEETAIAFLHAIRAEWKRRITFGARLPELPPLGVFFVPPQGRPTLLVRTDPQVHRDVVRSVEPEFRVAFAERQREQPVRSVNRGVVLRLSARRRRPQLR